MTGESVVPIRDREGLQLWYNSTSTLFFFSPLAWDWAKLDFTIELQQSRQPGRDWTTLVTRWRRGRIAPVAQDLCDQLPRRLSWSLCIGRWTHWLGWILLAALASLYLHHVLCHSSIKQHVSTSLALAKYTDYRMLMWHSQTSLYKLNAFRLRGGAGDPAQLSNGIVWRIQRSGTQIK